MTTTHSSRIVRLQRGPLGFLHQFKCTCGATSPLAVDREIAKLAKTSHERETGQG